MIRPVLYVDLPGIIYAIDRRARNKQHEFANFVCWLEPVRISYFPVTYSEKYLSRQHRFAYLDM